MATIKAFNLFYKRLGPTGSNPAHTNNWDGYLPESWYDIDVANYLSSSYLSFPKDTTITHTYYTTRTVYPTYRAIPWGSPACDLLWNCTVPSWSYVEDSNITINNWYRTWTPSLMSSRSFFYDNLAGGSSYGVSSYRVTSSWHVVDAKLLYAVSTPMMYLIRTGYGLGPSAYPTYIGSAGASVATETSANYAYDLIYPTISTNSSSSFDGDFFDIGTGVGITALQVSQSMRDESVAAANTNNQTNANILYEALTRRRLFFPTGCTNSGATTTWTDYRFKEMTGYNRNTILIENGGIYNVQFTLKRYRINPGSPGLADYAPMDGSHLKVFIHRIASTGPNVQFIGQLAAGRIPGADTWYPPDNNIVTIGSGYNVAPVMSFLDPETGLLIEKFNINLIQYGQYAQLCFEASGDTSALQAYFGIIIDDVTMCKIGVSTDPAFIKPYTAQTLAIDNLYGRAGLGLKVICTKLHQLGLLDTDIYELDQLYGNRISTEQPRIYAEYRIWADPIVSWMSGDGPNMLFWIKDKKRSTALQTKIIIKIMQSIVQPWAMEMAHQIDREKFKTSTLTGRMLLKGGLGFFNISSRLKRKVKETPKQISYGRGLVILGLLGYIKLMMVISNGIDKITKKHDS